MTRTYRRQGDTKAFASLNSRLVRPHQELNVYVQAMHHASMTATDSATSTCGLNQTPIHSTTAIAVHQVPLTVHRALQIQTVTIITTAAKR